MAKTKQGGKHLSPEEYETLKAYLIQNPSIPSLCLELLCRTGMRQGELVNLTRECFDLKRGTVYISSIKDSQPRNIPLSAEFIGRLTPLIKRLEDGFTLGRHLCTSDRYLSQTKLVQREFLRVMALLFGDSHGYTTHCLRHTFALNMLKQVGFNYQKVQLTMGHKNINNTLKYLQYLQYEDIVDDVLKAVG